MASCAALKLAAACLLLMCTAADILAQPSLASPLPSLDGKEAAAGRVLMRELLEDHDLAEQLGLAGQRGRGDLSDICPAACQTCLILCAVSCVLAKEPITCFVNCTVNGSCFAKRVETLPLVA